MAAEGTAAPGKHARGDAPPGIPASTRPLYMVARGDAPPRSHALGQSGSGHPTARGDAPPFFHNALGQIKALSARGDAPPDSRPAGPSRLYDAWGDAPPLSFDRPDDRHNNAFVYITLGTQFDDSYPCRGWTTVSYSCWFILVRRFHQVPIVEKTKKTVFCVGLFCAG